MLFINSFNIKSMNTNSNITNELNSNNPFDDPNLNIMPKMSKFNKIKLSETVNSHME